MNAFLYLVQVNLYLLLFYLFYVAMLRNETFFKMNRFYLVGTAVLSLVLPVLKAVWIQELFITEKVQELTQSVTQTLPAVIDQGNITLTNVQEVTFLTPATCIWLVYVAISAAFLLKFLIKLFALKRIFSMKYKGRAFSFFGKIAVDEELDGKEIIMKHELVHARQWHSADVIFFELFLAMNWFNPIAYFYRKAIQNIHEFIADDSAASTLEDRSAYALLLVSSVFNTQPQRLTNNFFNQSLLKRRIIMLHKTKSRKVAILKYGLSAPLFAGMLIFSSATNADARIIREIGNKAAPVMANFSNMDLNPIRQVVENIPNPPKPKVVKKNASTTASKKSKTDQYPSNLVDYAYNFKEKRSSSRFKEGLIFLSFEVNKDKKAVNFKITKSDNFDWQDDFLAYMNDFSDTVALVKGTYQFYKGFVYAGNEDKYPDDKTLQSDTKKMLFGGYITRMPSFVASDETKLEAGKIVNYLTETPLEDPVVLVDGKEVTYTKIDKRIKLDQTIYPRGLKTINVFKGDQAVKEYNESARNGLIVITTKEQQQITRDK